MVDGTTFSTEDAYRVGLVHDLIGETKTKEIKGKTREVAALSKDDFISEVLTYASQYTSPNKASLAVESILNEAVQTGGDLPLESGLAVERELQAKLFASADAHEGLTAFVEKRKSEFRNQ